MNISYIIEEYEINQLLENIKNLGYIYYNNFKNCPINLSENKKYIIGKQLNTLTKIGKNEEWIGIICEEELKKDKKYRWKIRILNSYNNLRYFKVGVSPIDFDINSSSYNYGWYINCYDSTLDSGPPHNYKNKKTNLNIVKKEITIIMDMNNGSLKFIIDNEDKSDDSYKNIPLDKPITPSIFLYYFNDSIEIIKY